MSQPVDLKVSFHGLSVDNCPSVDSCSSNVAGSDIDDVTSVGSGEAFLQTPSPHSVLSPIMSEPVENSPSFPELSINNSPSVDSCSSNVTGSDIDIDISAGSGKSFHHTLSVHSLSPPIMSEPVENSPSNDLKVGFHGLSVNNSDSCSSTVTGSDIDDITSVSCTKAIHHTPSAHSHFSPITSKAVENSPSFHDLSVNNSPSIDSCISNVSGSDIGVTSVGSGNTFHQTPSAHSPTMSKAIDNSPNNDDPISPKASFHDLSVTNSPSIDSCISNVTGSDITSVGAFHQTPSAHSLLPPAMTKALNNSSTNDDPISLKVSFHDLSITNSPTVSDITSVGSSKLSNGGFIDKQVDVKNDSEEESGNTSLSSVSYGRDVNEASFRTVCSSKPHKGNDRRWDAIQFVQCRDGDLGLGHFRLLKKLGFGDIGSVYLAELRGMGCLFAIKVMDKGMLVSRKKVARAQTERDILSLLDHPFLPTLYSHFETDKFSCLLMEFCSGGDLHLLRQRQPAKHFSEQAARFYASQVLLSLEYLHMMGVVYRDLKPENVLVREDGHIMLSDFDLSLQCLVNPTLLTSTNGPVCTISSHCIQQSCKLPVCAEPSCFRPSCFKPRLFASKPKSERTTFTSSDSLPMLVAEPTTARSMSFVGTHEYLAPEIIRGDGHGSAVDWWTFGVFLYELLHGKTPFKGTGNRETLFNVVGQPLKFPEGSTISFAAKDLIRSLLAKDPQKRLGFKRGATEIKQHPFFESINWALIRSQTPPQIPKPVDLTSFNRAMKASNHNSGTNSERSSGPYLDFDFF